MVLSKVTDTPGALPVSTRNRLMPKLLSPADLVRAATTMRSATCASGTNSLVPEMTNPSSAGRACTSTIPSASKRPEGSVIARVATREPSAIFGRWVFFCSSDPPIRIVWPARSTDDRKGDGSSAAPISSRMTVRSTNPRPWPPYSSGNARPSQPRACHLLPELRRVAALLLHHLPHESTGAILRQEIARRLPQQILLLAEAKIHRSNLLSGNPSGAVRVRAKKDAPDQGRSRASR